MGCWRRRLLWIFERLEKEVGFRIVWVCAVIFRVVGGCAYCFFRGHGCRIKIVAVCVGFLLDIGKIFYWTSSYTILGWPMHRDWRILIYPWFLACGVHFSMVWAITRDQTVTWQNEKPMSISLRSLQKGGPPEKNIAENSNDGGHSRIFYRLQTMAFNWFVLG